jgi:hypothetical protein
VAFWFLQVLVKFTLPKAEPMSYSKKNPDFIIYKWSIKADNVYKFLFFEYASTLASYKNEVSGFIRKEKFPEFHRKLKSMLNWRDLKIVTTKTYSKLEAWKSKSVSQ